MLLFKLLPDIESVHKAKMLTRIEVLGIGSGKVAVEAPNVIIVIQ